MVSRAKVKHVRRVLKAQPAVLAWYDEHHRSFAFRGPRDPYQVLVSEVILQQTQASRGEPAWRAFVGAFPTVADLAAASPAAVLRAWAGLGYNRRALNLRRAAVALMTAHGGTFPRSVVQLEELPGVGPYTARAVAAIAFGEPVGPVDTNVRRMLGRVVAGHGAKRDPGESLRTADLQALADAVVPPARPADWTAALMDLGATICLPRNPACDRCPLATVCAYAAHPAPTTARPARRVREPAAGYETTSRWLRGRLVARLRDLPDGAWAVFDGPLGVHDEAAVGAALAALAGEGLVEMGEGGRVRLPLR